MSASSDKLAKTRLAIIEHVHRKEHRREAAADDVKRVATGSRAPAGDEGHREGEFEGEGWLAHARHALRTWWRYHPAHMAVDIATPALASYARRKPVQYLGIAAAAGALFLLARPWKLISITGVAVALLKSPQISALLTSAMSSSHNPRDDEAAP